MWALGPGPGARTKRDAKALHENVCHIFTERGNGGHGRYLTYFCPLGGKSESQERNGEQVWVGTGAHRQWITPLTTTSTVITRDMAMATTSEEPVMTFDSELWRLGGIEAWKLKAGPVRRNLFGSVDHQQLQQDFQQLLHMSVEEANKRWNFDFQTDRPGEGSGVQWVELTRRDVPAFYHSCTVRPVARARSELTEGSRRMSSSSGEGSPMSSSSSAFGDDYLEVTARGCYRLQRSGKRRQLAITDFFKVKRRRLLQYKASSRQ